ncbi:hypothetical protein AB0N73_09385 [Microbacterium sp. NPDC089189]|uniref:hypothetical protein n=1 Tax=Microbacterium sp. NPDC089189 TaxID=3154972 RepID=UPI0034160177
MGELVLWLIIAFGALLVIGGVIAAVAFGWGSGGVRARSRRWYAVVICVSAGVGITIAPTLELLGVLG